MKKQQWIAKIKSRLKSQKGFSLAEVLMAVMILLMVSAVVAAGIPVAANAYNKVTKTANAQMLLSTTMTVLRSELKSASNIEVSAESGNTQNTIITYDNSLGIPTKIYLDSEEGIMIQNYAEGESPGSSSDDYNHTLVSSAAGGDSNLYITYDNVGYSGNIITFNSLTVKNKSNTSDELAEQDSYKIRVLVGQEE